MTPLAYLSIGISAVLFGTIAGTAAAAPDIRLPAESVSLRPSKLPGFAIAQQKCAICHSADYVAYQPPGMNLTQWTAEMAKMQHLYGAPIDDAEVRLLGIYFAATYGDAKSVGAADMALAAAPPPTAATAASRAGMAVPAAAGAGDVQALLGGNACLSCHGLVQKIVGPGYREVAARYKADPEAVSKLQASIRSGSVGKWGPAPMPPFPGLGEAQLKALAEFVMKQ